ncbi:DHHA2 domain-containing protein [Raoultibacter timonensis]|uniref:DHHA2 domain-containing protein n=1 Tax=Raoultibacter timonensis TaxID=1907662 RepID=UPI001FD3F78C|nr:DHHA2 domain-containing protein [Raoultibacter timonensis]
MPVDKLVGADSKEFQLGDSTVLIAQHETVDLPAVMEREDEIRAYMRQLKDDNGYEFVLFMVTDIMAEGSQFLCEGNRRIVDRVFNIKCTGVGGTWMPGILSRKKQVAARILGS